MVSIAVMAGGALVNALAFSGTNYPFGMLGGAERKRTFSNLDVAMQEYYKATAFIIGGMALVGIVAYKMK